MLDPLTISRVSGASPDTLSLLLPKIHDELREATRTAYIAGQIQSAAEMNASDILKNSEQRFDLLWNVRSNREQLVRGSEVIRILNLWLEVGGYHLIDAFALASAVRPQSLSSELVGILFRFEDLMAARNLP